MLARAAETERAGLSESSSTGSGKRLIEKLEGVSDDDAWRTPTVSSLSRLSLVKHSAIWERRWFQVVVAGRGSVGEWPEGLRRRRERISTHRRRHRGERRRALPERDRRVAGDPEDVRSRRALRLGVGSEPAVGGGAHDRGDRSPRWPCGHHPRDDRRQPRESRTQGGSVCDGWSRCRRRRSFDGVLRRARAGCVRPRAWTAPAGLDSDGSRVARSIPAGAPRWSTSSGRSPATRRCRPTTPTLGLESFGVDVPVGETRWIITQMGPGSAALMHSTPHDRLRTRGRRRGRARPRGRIGAPVRGRLGRGERRRALRGWPAPDGRLDRHRHGRPPRRRTRR